MGGGRRKKKSTRAGRGSGGGAPRGTSNTAGDTVEPTQQSLTSAPESPSPQADAAGPGGLWGRFWDGLVLHPDQVRLFRFVFYGLVAVDGFLELEHAPRYGAGGFNVSHFPWLDGLLPVPDRRIMVLLWVLQCFLALRMAFGVGTRRTAVALTGVFGAAYFWSQLDSYQHHYLLFLLLGIAACVDWRSKDPPTWPFRLILAQVSIVYLWAAVTKMHPLWLDGTLISRQIPSGPMPDWVASVAGTVGMAALNLWAVIAVGAMLGELFLAVALHVRRLRLPAVVLGLGLHGGIEYAGFKIGLFSYFMFGLYLLVVPPRFFAGRAEPPPRTASAPWWTLGVAIAVGGAAVGSLFPIEGIWLAVAVASGWALLEELPARSSVGLRHRAVVHAVSCLIVLGLHANTDILRDYWKYRGGDTRRRGEVVQAIDAYEQVVAIDPDYASGHARLSDLYRRNGELEPALAEARLAEKYDPKESAHPARAARLQKALGDLTAARLSAQRAVGLGNNDADIQSLAR